MLEGWSGVNRGKKSTQGAPCLAGWVEACGCVTATFYGDRAATLSQLCRPSWCTSDTGCHRLQGAASSLYHCCKPGTVPFKDTAPVYWAFATTFRWLWVTIPLLYTTGKHGPRDRRQLFAGGDSRVRVVLLWPRDWVGEGVSDIVKYSGGFVPVPERSESRWQKNSAAWLDTLTVSYGMFPPLRLLSLSDSHIAPARNKLLRPTNEATSLLLKTITVRKMTLSPFSFFPPSSTPTADGLRWKPNCVL